MTDISDLRFSHIPVNGISLHVAEAGPLGGPLVILLHGFPEFWYGWRNQIGPLAAAGYHVVVPDQRGYNLSDKPQGTAPYDLDSLAADVVALAGHYGHDHFSLVGHDWGAIVAWWTAQTYPQNVERLLAAGASHPAVWADAFRNNPRQRRKSYYVRLFQIPWLPEQAMRARNFKLLADAVSDTAIPGTVTDADLAQYRAAWGQPGALTTMVNYYRAVKRRTLLPPKTYRIRVPTIMVWGMKDRYGEPELATASVALCDQGEVVRFEKATHWIQHDEPERFTALLLDFLQRPLN